MSIGWDEEETPAGDGGLQPFEKFSQFPDHFVLPDAKAQPPASTTSAVWNGREGGA